MSPVEKIRAAAEAMRQDAADNPQPNPWHPAVALAVADWLDMHAADLADANGYVGACDSPGDTMHALAVARTYLGRAEQ